MPNPARRPRASLKDILSHLTFVQASKLLGDRGKDRLTAGSSLYHAELDLDEDARFDGNSFIY